eukprot:2741705-Prymnesium_polylepis.1
MCHENREADWERGQVLLVAADDTLSVCGDRLCVHCGLEHDVDEQRRAHHLREKGIADRHGRALEAVGAEATGAIEAARTRRSREQQGSTDNGAQELGRQIDDSAQWVTGADNREGQRDSAVDVAAARMRGSICQHGDPEPKLQRDDRDRCRVPLTADKMCVAGGCAAPKVDEEEHGEKLGHRPSRKISRARRRRSRRAVEMSHSRAGSHRSAPHWVFRLGFGPRAYLLISSPRWPMADVVAKGGV